MNNTSVERSPLPGVSQRQGALTILALPEYNGTVVECVALFFDGSSPELTPPVYLLVEGIVVEYHNSVEYVILYVSVMSFTTR